MPAGSVATASLLPQPPSLPPTDAPPHLQALEDGAVLAVGGQDVHAVLLGQRQHKGATRNQRLLVGQANVLAWGGSVVQPRVREVTGLQSAPATWGSLGTVLLPSTHRLLLDSKQHGRNTSLHRTCAPNHTCRAGTVRLTRFDGRHSGLESRAAHNAGHACISLGVRRHCGRRQSALRRASAQVPRAGWYAAWQRAAP